MAIWWYHLDHLSQRAETPLICAFRIGDDFLSSSGQLQDCSSEKGRFLVGFSIQLDEGSNQTFSLTQRLCCAEGLHCSDRALAIYYWLSAARFSRRCWDIFHCPGIGLRLSLLVLWPLSYESCSFFSMAAIFLLNSGHI